MENKIKKSVMVEAKKRGLILEEDSKSDFVVLISILLHSRTQVHTFHLQTESFAEHKALEDYYDNIVGMIDTIVESYQGKYGIIKGYKNYPIVDYNNNESTITFFETLCEKVTKLRDCCDESWLQNEIDNVCTLINKTLYKLKFLK